MLHIPCVTNRAGQVQNSSRKTALGVLKALDSLSLKGEKWCEELSQPTHAHVAPAPSPVTYERATAEGGRATRSFPTGFANLIFKGFCDVSGP
jgi:hypothetical protein